MPSRSNDAPARFPRMHVRVTRGQRAGTPLRAVASKLIAAFIALQGTGCPQSANAQQESVRPATPARPERSSEPFVEGETCTRTDDCPRGARCFDGRCQLTTRSLQGEVLGERGARALAMGRHQDAAEAYRAAERAYRERGLPVPATITCGLARALLALNDRGGAAQDAREAAARALTGCLAASPPGGSGADQALAGLASLSERGLDVAALDRPDAALMTGRDPRPTVENTRVRLTFTGQGTGSRASFRDLVNGEPIAREITRCFLSWWESSHQNEDQGTLRVSYVRSYNEDEDYLGSPRLTVSAADIVPTATDAGTPLHWLQCAASVIQNAAATLRWPGSAERWNESIVVSVGPR